MGRVEKSIYTVGGIFEMAKNLETWLSAELGVNPEVWN